ncbi:MAG: Hsp70 family protein [Candidatus Protochlamydia sp.]|nr:Hsp70 family protein [Candidatus Protochlamydia sp.]
MRYIIGVDLGTTNSAVAYRDIEKPHAPIQMFSIPQLTAIGKIEALAVLPSFCYLFGENEWPAGAFRLPWKEETSSFVGQFAKSQGSRLPTRLVQSAKSWLCNVASDRHAKILPIVAADTSQRISPVEASSRYLIHIKEAWNHAHAKAGSEEAFEEQDIILTVPASFDEVARTLTVEAARKAGLQHVTLLEEPQGAFYSWISQHEKTWKQLFHPGESILICDVGGGTTDFSLIEIQERNEELIFQRMAVGDHLLLGGDNMDAAVAHYLEEKLKKESSQPLETTQWLQLLAVARQAKEALLGPNIKPEDSFAVVLQGAGSSVIKGSLSTAINHDEVRSLLGEGFFFAYELKEALNLKKSRGFRTVGLPYEDDPSIIKHLAQFLKQAGYFEPGKSVDHLLFNGGAMKPALFQSRILESLGKWFLKEPPKLLTGSSLDLGVARGAAYYGGVRRGYGISIGGGLPRSYYLELDWKDSSGHMLRKALTLLPRGSEEGQVFQPAEVFALRANTPVAFHLLTSHVRLNDLEGDKIDIDEQEIHRLPPIQTILRFGRQSGQEEQLVPVRLSLALTPVGTLDLWLDSQKTNHRWNLEFQLRSASGHDHSLMTQEKKRQDETFDAGYVEGAKLQLEVLFEASSVVRPGEIMELLEKKLEAPKKDWSLSVLRALFDSLLKLSSGRKLSPEHEARWWNLAGYFLRPGYGFPLDDFRIKELWKIILGDLKLAKSQESQIQCAICYRRIAGGLNKGQQAQLGSDLMNFLFDKRTGKLISTRKNEAYIYSEKIRAFASLERLELPVKIRVGDSLIDKIKRNEAEAYDYWSVARIGARHLVYGTAGQVVPKDICEKWVKQLLETSKEPALFAVVQLARRTDHREINLSEEMIGQIALAYPEADMQALLSEKRHLSQYEQEQLFGEKLPPGLILDQA